MIGGPFCTDLLLSLIVLRGKHGGEKTKTDNSSNVSASSSSEYDTRLHLLCAGF